MRPSLTKRVVAERYELERSPFCQKLTQREFAELIGWTKSQLEALITHKDNHVVRRQAVVGKKQKLRNLVYPVGKLRRVHERLKHHLNKIRQPEYLCSPRQGRAQRDNALTHAGRNHFLKLDIKQFYPSTSAEHVYRWAFYDLGLRDDVAGLFMHLVTIDGRLPFGSPLSPVLASLVHRGMFDAIYALCQSRGLRMSLWVDDLTISGLFVPGELVTQIREVVRLNGLESHKVEFLTSSNRQVIVTGVPIEGGLLMPTRAMHQRLQDGYRDLREAGDDWTRGRCIDQLLSVLGSIRYQVGPSSIEEQIAANRMNGLRQRRKRLTMAKVVSVSV